MVGWIGRTLSGLFGSVGVSGTRSNRKIAEGLYREIIITTNSKYDPADDGEDYALELAVEVLDSFGIPLTGELLKAIADCIDPFILDAAITSPEIDWDNVDHEGDEGIRLRRYLERHKNFHSNATVNTQRFSHGLLQIFGSLFGDLSGISLSEGSKGFGVQLGELIPSPNQAIELLVGNVFSDDLQDAKLFEDLRNRLERNICAASGIDYHNQPNNLRSFRMPRDFKGDKQELFQTYLSYTPFKKLLETPLPFTIPSQARFEHTHIVGGTGQGKTQLMSHLILQDLGAILGGEHKSVVVIDSQGDLVRKISSMAVFHPTNIVGLADKLVLIDPRDVEYPTALNIFAINKERLEQYGPVERERVFNGAVELYEHFFKGLLGAELTAKQGVAFTYMSRMMLELPNATIYTLRDLMDNPHAFKDQIANLSPGTRMFFERELLSKSYNQTRRQISQRIWGMLSIPAFERMFGQSQNKVDLFDLLNSGKIILINTSKDLLKEEGSAIFGKFFLAAIGQAIGERAVLAESERTDTIIYLDEAHEYADQSLEVLLTQGRKYRAGVVIAHQFLDQLDSRARQSLLANASVKIVGGLSYKDNQAFAREMGTTTDFLSSLRKEEKHSKTEFGLWIKHQIPEALRLSVPFGLLESAKRLDHLGEQLLLEQNRAWYCVPASQTALPDLSTEILEEPIKSEPAITKAVENEPLSGRGGDQHREIQQMIKDIGHDLGFGVSIEAACTNSDGFIDVLLGGEQNTIAIEISVTTSPQHELENLTKCLAESTDYVLCISPDDVHRQNIQNLCIEQLPQSQMSSIVFLNPREIAEYLNQFDERETTLIRGYEVITQIVQSDPRDVLYRKNRIRMVLERRLRT